MSIKPIILSFLVCFFATYCSAQNSFAGRWEGQLNVGKTVRLVFNITNTDTTLSCTMDSPDQGVTGLSCQSVQTRQDSIIITTLYGKAAYRGLKTDSTSISGIFQQNGFKVPLNLKRTGIATVLNRPQTPKPPFDYIIEHVIYHNEQNNIQYGATITIPKGKGPFPALVLITGSGQQNRDEEIFGHKPFAVIADYLTKKGYAVLRVDDRGVGESTGDVISATSEDFMKDVMVSLGYLRSRQEVDKKRVGLMGHSEGGMIAPMIAANDKEIDFIVLLAGPGIKCAELMAEQSAAIMEKSGTNKEAIAQYIVLYKQMAQSGIETNNKEELKKEITREVMEWRAKTSPDIVLETTHISNDSTERAFINMTTKAYSIKWLKYFMAYDPGENLKKLSCKVLALNGEKDMQVLAKSNLAGIKKSLSESKTKNYTTVELKGLNHLFQECHTCDLDEYATLEETFSPKALGVIDDWLDKNVK